MLERSGWNWFAPDHKTTAMTIRAYDPRTFVPLLLCVYCLCAFAYLPVQTRSGTAVLTRAVDGGRMLAPLGPVTQYPMVTACELDKIEQEFDNRVFSTAGGAKLDRPSFKFTLQSLKDLLENQEHPSKSTALVMVHYGSDAQGAMTYGIGLTHASHANMAFATPTVFYVPQNQVLAAWTGAGTWMSQIGSKYTAPSPGQNVFIKRNHASGIEPFDPNEHAYFVMFETHKILQFMNDNLSSSSGHVADMVELVSYAHLRDAEDHYHGVAFVAWDDTLRMVDDVESRKGFDMRAMDLGTPCPQNCNPFVSLYKGERVPNCP
jgi:hypothetical protein